MDYQAALTRVIDDVAAPVAEATPLEGQPEFGERVDEAPRDDAPDTKKSDD